MTEGKQVVLVTGGNSGIGFELCNQLAAKGNYHVIMGSRSIEKGQEALKDLESRNLPGFVEFVPLDVTDDTTIGPAVKHIEGKLGRLDVLVNNAAVSGANAEGLRAQMQQSFETNAIGPAVLTEAFTHLLRKSTGLRRIVHVSTGGASIAMRLDPENFGYNLKATPYRVSKCAQSMVAACQAYEYKDDGIKVFMYSPGFTVSNLGPHNKAEHGARPTTEAVCPLVDIIEGKRDDEVNLNLHDTGSHPW